MNALIKKEIRLLIPTWTLGIGIALASIEVSRIGRPGFSFLLLMSGAVVAVGIALATFGREFGHGTFSGLLALPVSRARLWWTKVLVLAAALLSLYVVWWISFEVCAVRWSEVRRNAMDNGLTPFTSGLLLLAAFSGGLWTTLVFRQITAAIWFAILVPALLFTSGVALAEHLSDNPTFHRAIFSSIALVYGVGGFALAWWMFLRVQDAQWTGGIISLPRWGRRTARTEARRKIKTNRPTRALLQKELQLYHVVLLIAAGFSLLHLAVVLIRKWGGGFPEHPTLAALLGAFWGLWLIMPFLVSATAVAEERKLGTLDTQLCLPAGWRRQFFVKFSTAVVLGTFLGSLPACLLEGTQLVSEVGSLVSIMIFSGIISLVSFYASTLARHTLQAAGIALVLALLGGLIMSWIEWPEQVFGALLWRGNVGWIVGAPVVGGVLLALSIRNFRIPGITGRIWIRNAAILGIALISSLVMASAIYHRLWEFAQDTDPEHGTARMALNEPLRLLHDGRLAVLRLGSGQLIDFDNRMLIGAKASGRPVHTDHGTNWISVVTDVVETIAIRGDGTLWVSERPRVLFERDSTPPARLVQVGDDHWRQVVRDLRAFRSVLLLKSDGTLWRWRETNSTDIRKSRLMAPRPYRLGTETNWAKLTLFSTRLDLTKTDGSVWSVHFQPTTQRIRTESIELEPGYIIEREPGFDGIHWLSGTRFRNNDLGVQSDGTLWLMGRLLWNRRETMEQFDPSTDWKEAAGAFGNRAIALKSDGSLWKLGGNNWNERPRARRLSQHSDWLAVAADTHMLYALAADGSIWGWEGNDFRAGGFQAAPSRIPVRIANLFDPSR